ncbi:hypothetical protein A2973_01240 [Candidatus Gottesmanbacteria bacterium RIFCSPLOWO2_01_FULL_49_10]|uniref:Cohesin domain-containing protein n=1 Tax=Candidatus Gottesmanbacteria bacterium RIFCSPLOWO2_01_FULL_49_10 TaxID=1798396 RepID=A0A1F6AXQ5_9BACT|nr:MAG: hypothetical protein A2973_01240 [Candidatus Gottesmanbacteria bacterium RIFCSPLOWO2_01_FULL_49_10]
MQTQVNWKIILLCLVLFSGLISVLIFGKNGQMFKIRSRASGTVVLRLTPGEKFSSKGETWDISLLVDTKEDAISAVDLFLAYDMTKLQLTGVNASDRFPITLLSPVSENGFIHVALASSPSSPFRGVGIVATMSFQALSDGETLITLADQSMVAAIGKNDNVLSQTYPSLITIRSSTGATATPTPTGFVTPTSTRESMNDAEDTPTPSPDSFSSDESDNSDETPNDDTPSTKEDPSVAVQPEPDTSPGFIGFGTTPRLPAESEYTIPGQYTLPKSPFPPWLDAFFRAVADIVCRLTPCT